VLVTCINIYITSHYFNAVCFKGCSDHTQAEKKNIHFIIAIVVVVVVVFVFVVKCVAFH